MGTKKWTKRVTDWVEELKAKLVLQVAITKADGLHVVHGVRYWAVPTPEGSLLVLNWQEVLEYRELGIFPKKMTVQGLYAIAFYWTDSKRRGNRGFQRKKETLVKEKYMMWWWGTRRRRERKK